MTISEKDIKLAAQRRLHREEMHMRRLEDAIEINKKLTKGLITSYPPEIADAVQCIEDLLNDEDGAYEEAMNWLEMIRTKYPPRRLIDKMKIL